MGSVCIQTMKISHNWGKMNRGAREDSLQILGSVESLSKKPPLQNLGFKWWEHVTSIYRNYKTVEVIANSIGAYFAINALSNQQIEKAYFISPVVDMERLIADMMIWANVTEDELKEKKEIQTTFGETLSWDYLCYARENPIIWEIPTHILYGEKDNLTAYGTIFEFVQRTNSTLSIMKNGEHWFHTDEQMKFLDEWIIKSSK